MLWERYALRQREPCTKHGYQGDNENLLFHGADNLALEAIVNEGFDMRITNGGSLGRGNPHDACADWCLRRDEFAAEMKIDS